ncbi:hypothetical protein BDW68DRAFT_162994 [Aspergillus falconensis]
MSAGDVVLYGNALVHLLSLVSYVEAASLPCAGGAAVFRHSTSFTGLLISAPRPLGLGQTSRPC